MRERVLTKRNAATPRPTSRWVLTCLVLGLIFTIAHSFATLGFIAILEAIDPPEETDLPDLGSALLFSVCGFYGAPLFGGIWTSGFISFKRRLRRKPEHCSYCGWKLRRDENHRCWICGTPPAGSCLQCGYDLRGDVSGTCPECGRPFEPKGDAP